jgi:hypothetical protein
VWKLFALLARESGASDFSHPSDENLSGSAAGVQVRGGVRGRAVAPWTQVMTTPLCSQSNLELRQMDCGLLDDALGQPNAWRSSGNAEYQRARSARSSLLGLQFGTGLRLEVKRERSR